MIPPVHYENVVYFLADYQLYHARLEKVGNRRQDKLSLPLVFSRLLIFKQSCRDLNCLIFWLIKVQFLSSSRLLSILTKILNQ